MVSKVVGGTRPRPPTFQGWTGPRTRQLESVRKSDTRGPWRGSAVRAPPRDLPLRLPFGPVMTGPDVVTLLPSATEIVYALGAEPAAVSHECAYPPAAADKPRANTCVVDPDATSTAINEQLAAHDEIYEIDRETLRAIDPDVVITQGVCDVCAVDSVLVENAIAEMAIDPVVLTTDPHSVADVLDDVRRIGEAIGRGSAADRLVTDLRERIASVEERARTAVADAGRPRVLVLDWLAPPMVAGHWVPELVDLAGGEYGVNEQREAATPEDFEVIAAFDPAKLVLAPCGFSIDQARRDVDELADHDRWPEVSAVRADEVYAMDGRVLNCPSPRLVDALETLASVLHPDHFETPVDGFERVTVRTPV